MVRIQHLKMGSLGSITGWSRGSGHGTGAPSLLANVSELGLPLAASFLPQPLLPAWHPNVGLLLEAEINPHICLLSGA